VSVGNIIGQLGRARYGTDGQGLGNWGWAPAIPLATVVAFVV